MNFLCSSSALPLPPERSTHSPSPLDRENNTPHKTTQDIRRKTTQQNYAKPALRTVHLPDSCENFQHIHHSLSAIVPRLRSLPFTGRDESVMEQASPSQTQVFCLPPTFLLFRLIPIAVSFFETEFVAENPRNSIQPRIGSASRSDPSTNVWMVASSLSVFFLSSSSPLLPLTPPSLLPHMNSSPLSSTSCEKSARQAE